MNESEERFSLVDGLFIDDGTLDRVDARLAFCLGVEFAMFRERLLRSEAFVETVHEKNLDRIVKLCRNHGRRVTYNIKEPGWYILAVQS